MKSINNQELLDKAKQKYDKAKQKYDKALKEFIAIQVEGVYDHKLTNELVDKIKRGDVQAKEELIRLHKEFIKVLVSRFKKVSQRSEDELVGAAHMGFVQAALNFNEDDGFSFIAYAVWYINRRIVEDILGLHAKVVA